MPRQWYDRAMPEDWGASLPEWEWYCFRAKGRRLDEARRAEEAKEKPPERGGATAGWRRATVTG